jgi:hypothetical protein
MQASQEGRQSSQLWWEERALIMASGEVGNTQIVMLGLRNRSCTAGTTTWSSWNEPVPKVVRQGQG